MRRAHVLWVMPSALAAAALTAAALTACSFAWEDYDPLGIDTEPRGGGGSAVSTGGMGGGGSGPGGNTTSSGGGHGGSGAMGGGGGTGGGGTGAGAGTLVSSGLLVRYFLDEAASGQGPTEIADSAPDPFDLPITYSPTMVWSSAATGRGLSWGLAGADGAPTAPVIGTKVLDRLGGKTAATFEVVANIVDCVAADSRLVHIGGGNLSRLSLECIGGDTLAMDINDHDPTEGWQITLATLGRAVIHVVIDTALPSATERVRLFIGATEVTGGTGAAMPQSEAFGILGTDALAIGNRDNGERSTLGSIYYAALYDRALSEPEIVANAAVLKANDDTPP